MISHVTIILPAKNEADNIAWMIPRLISSYKKSLEEILIIDDCSTDDTHIVANTLKKKYKLVRLISRKPPSGVGLAIRDGIAHISKRTKYILTMDSDFRANLADIKTFFLTMDSYDGLVGSRFIRNDSLKNYPLLKRLANRLYHLVAKILLRVPHADVTNNFKLYRRELIESISPLLVSSDFSINAELGYYPILLGAHIGEIPVRWEERTAQMGLSKFKILRVGPSYIRIFFRLFIIKLFRTHRTN